MKAPQVQCLHRRALPPRLASRPGGGVLHLLKSYARTPFRKKVSCITNMWHMTFWQPVSRLLNIIVPSAEIRSVVFGIPLRDSLRYANVQISTANTNGGELYIYGYVPVVVAKWLVMHLRPSRHIYTGTNQPNLLQWPISKGECHRSRRCLSDQRISKTYARVADRVRDTTKSALHSFPAACAFTDSSFLPLVRKESRLEAGKLYPTRCS